MGDNPTDQRRKLLKALTLGGGAAGVASLPGTWTRPVVDSVSLPAHAVTTGPGLFGSISAPGNVMVPDPVQDGFVDAALLSQLIGAAQAGEPTQVGGSIEAFTQSVGDDNMRLEVLLTLENPEFRGADSGFPEALVGTAHAQLDCFVQVLFDQTVAVTGSGENFQSAVLNFPAPVASCGLEGVTNLEFFGSYQLFVNHPVFATSGFLRLYPDSEIIDASPVDLPLFPGGGPLTANCLGFPCQPVLDSDRDIKEDFSEVDEQEILKRVSELPINYWNYTDRDPGVRHIGPMAQDFHGAFAVGDSDRHIHVVDANGVNLASIKALYRMLRDKDEKIARLESELELIKEKLGIPG